MRAVIATDFRRAFGLAPLVILALAVYSGLPSRFVFPDEVDTIQNLSPWHPGFFNVGDLVLIGAVFMTVVIYRPRLDRQSAIFLSFALIAVLISLFFGSKGTEPESVLASSIYWLRFAIGFSGAIWITQHAGTRASESVLVVLFAILCVTALTVFSIWFGTFNRIYSSAMTVASFSQVAAVVILIGVVRRHYVLIAFAMLFLILTFSFTSISLMLGLSALYLLTTSSLPARQRMLFMSLILGLLVVGGYVAMASGQFDFLYARIFGSANDTSTLETFHGRTVIWQYGLAQFNSGSVGLLGIGFNQTPSLLSQITFSLRDAGINDPGTFTVVHFHTIWLEFSIGLGILSLVLLVPLLFRIGQTWIAGCYPAALIFAFFLLCQTVDFTLYRPKETVLWGLMLGIAEGQWRLYSAARPLTSLNALATPTEGKSALRLQEQGH